MYAPPPGRKSGLTEGPMAMVGLVLHPLKNLTEVKVSYAKRMVPDGSCAPLINSFV